MSEPTTAERPPGRNATAGRDHPPVDALVAIVPTLADFERIRDEHWYRVPVAKAPACLRDGQVGTVAFYLPKVFREDAWQVRCAAPVVGMTVLPRRDLLPAEPGHKSAAEPYLRLALGPLYPLPRSIPSRRLRRITFIPTTRAKLAVAAEINDLFHASPLEDTLWEALKGEGIEAEREYFVPGDNNGRYALDFAIFGQERNLDVECDGDAYHLNRVKARYDNRRNNFLTTRGWSVLRFTSAQVLTELPEIMAQLRAAVRNCGGLAHAEPQPAPTAPPTLLWQPALWESSVATGHSVNPLLPAPRRARRRR